MDLRNMKRFSRFNSLCWEYIFVNLWIRYRLIKCMLKEYFYHTTIGFDIRTLGCIGSCGKWKDFPDSTLYVENILLAMYGSDTGRTFATFTSYYIYGLDHSLLKYICILIQNLVFTIVKINFPILSHIDYQRILSTEGTRS